MIIRFRAMVIAAVCAVSYGITHSADAATRERQSLVSEQFATRVVTGKRLPLMPMTDDAVAGRQQEIAATMHKQKMIRYACSAGLALVVGHALYNKFVPPAQATQMISGHAATDAVTYADLRNFVAPDFFKWCKVGDRISIPYFLSDEKLASWAHWLGNASLYIGTGTAVKYAFNDRDGMSWFYEHESGLKRAKDEVEAFAYGVAYDSASEDKKDVLLASAQSYLNYCAGLVAFMRYRAQQVQLNDARDALGVDQLVKVIFTVALEFCQKVDELVKYNAMQDKQVAAKEMVHGVVVVMNQIQSLKEQYKRLEMQLK